MMKRRLLVVAALALARAYAQENPPVVQVKANADSQRRNDTVSRITINRAEILEHGDTSVLDVLKRLPGVAVVDGTPRMRGLGAGYTQVLLNGERPPAGFSLEQLAPELIEKIEVLRAATAEYSTQAIAGTINIVLRKSVPRPSRELRAALNGAPGEFSGRFAPSLSDKDENFSYTAGGALNVSDVHRPEHEQFARFGADGTPLALRMTDGSVRDYFRAANANSRMNWTLAPGNTVAWQVFGQAFIFRADRSQASTVPLGPSYPYMELDYQRWERFANLRNEGSWSLRSDVGARLDTTLALDIADTLSKRRSRAADAGARPTLARYYLNTPYTQRASWTGKYAWPVQGGHTVTAGWDLSFSQLRNRELQQEDPGAVDGNFNRALRARVTRYAFYAQDVWELGPQLSLYAGLRHEAARTRTSGSDFVAQAARADVASPLLQALYKLPGSGKRQLRAALTRTFKSPEVEQLAPRSFRSIDNTAVSPDSSGNPALRPEIARDADFAFEQYDKDGALFSLGASTRLIQNVIRSTTEFDGARWVSAPRNLGTARAHSLEAEWKFPHGPLKLAFNLGRHWSEVDSVPGPGNRLARQSPWTGNASVDYRKGAWSAGASATLAAGGWSRASVEQFTYARLRRTLEAYAAWRSGDGSQWRLTAANLLHPDVLIGSRYVDTAGSTESFSHTLTRTSVRLAYEGQY